MSGFRSKHNRKFGAVARLVIMIVGLLAIGVICLTWIWFRNNTIDPIPIPDHKMPEENARDDFLRAAQLARQVQHRSPYHYGPPHSLADYAACAADAGPVISALRQGLSKPFMAPRRTDLPPTSTDLTALRELMREVSGVSDYYAIVGPPMRSAEIKLDLWQMAVMSARGGELITELVSVAIEDMATRGFEQLLPHLTEPELAKIAARLDTITTLRTPYADVLPETAYNDITILQRDLRARGGTSFSAARDSAGSGYDSNGHWSVGGELRADWKAVQVFSADKNRALRENLAYIQALAVEARKPYTGHSMVPVPHNVYGDLAVFYTARAKPLGAEATTAVIRTEVALLRYRRAFGRYPDRLQDLVPRYLKSAPEDPFGGAAGVPLKYRPKDNGGSFLIYGLGPDMLDHGGTPGRYPGDQHCDIVAGHLWRPLKLPARPPGAGH
jgi:hypothetical protein